MATAEKTTKTTERVVTEQTDVITLELNPTEARTLVTVLGAIGGQPDSRKRHTTQVFDALRKAGVPWDYTNAIGLVGGMRFE